jgi:RNA polymerase sigma-70 factor (ECF subfamily)
MEDADLVERARAGDLAAFEVLVARHQNVALRVAYAIVPMDAEDVVQDAFVKAHAALPRFRPGAPFRPWVLRIVTNEARNQHRRHARQTQLALREVARRAALPERTPESAAIDEEDRRVLADAISGLTPGDREVIALRWFGELTEAEMAAVLDCRPGTVKSRLSRALGRLRAALPAELVR